MRAPIGPPGPHLLASALCAGVAWALVVRQPSFAVPIAASALGALSIVARRGRLPVLAVGLFAAAWWWGSVRLDAVDRSVLAREIGTAALARVEVTAPGRPGRFSTRLPVQVKWYDDRAVDERAQLEIPASERAPPQGAVLELVVEVEAPQERQPGSSYDEATFLGRKGIHAVLHADSYRIIGRRDGLAGIADRIREHLAGSSAPGLTGERHALVAGIVLGEEEGLSDELREAFRRSGLYHVLAVSGQNVAYVVAGVLLAGWLLGVPRWAAQTGAIGAILCYVAAVGWQPSVVRAGIAGALASLAWLASRPRDRWYFMLLGALGLLAWNPYNLLDPGFQLSFAAVAAIFAAVPRLERVLVGYPVPRALGAVLAISTACGVATAPILWLHFGSIPILSVVANALGEPAVAPILGLGLAASAVDPVLPEAAAALAWVNGWVAAYLAGCARLVGGLPFAQISSGLAVACLAAAACLAVFLLRGPARLRRPAIVVVLCVAAAGAGWKVWSGAPELPPPDGLRVSFLDVGQGDAALIQVPEGAVLVDEGPPEARVADQLRRLGVRRLAAVVLTHPQRDHIGGAAEVIRTARVDAILDAGLAAESPYEDEALEVAAERGVRVVTARTGQRFRLGLLRLRVLWPDSAGPPGADPNDHAVVMLASYGAVDVLLTADAESNVTGRLELQPVEILKVAHHGSADSGLATLLERLQPRVAVISVGSHNDYGHPTAETLRALRRPGLRVYRTDRDGAVTVSSDGRRLEVGTSR